MHRKPDRFAQVKRQTRFTYRRGSRILITALSLRVQPISFQETNRQIDEKGQIWKSPAQKKSIGITPGFATLIVHPLKPKVSSSSFVLEERSCRLEKKITALSVLFSTS